MSEFGWTGFYQAVADKLLEYKSDRRPLVKGLADIFERQFPKFSKKVVPTKTSKDIDPFTVFAYFNRGGNENRTKVSQATVKLLGIKKPAPELFLGIPVVDPRATRFVDDVNDSEVVDALWSVFEDAINLADSTNKRNRSSFINSFNKAKLTTSVTYLSMGLYWIRPMYYPSLDGTSKSYLKDKLDVQIKENPSDGEEYLALRSAMLKTFQKANSPVHSFQELVYEGYEDSLRKKREESSPPDGSQKLHVPKRAIDEIFFMDHSGVDKMLERLEHKKNIILQGPPGTGKTWLADKLAHIFTGATTEDRVQHIQFHPNWSYEDFVRGYRPSEKERLKLVDGPFLILAERARNDPNNRYVCVIEEINRGNPSSVFGELLTLLEADKRTYSPKNISFPTKGHERGLQNQDDAEKRGTRLSLTYPRKPEERVSVPSNLYVIGTMNLADRSLAMVDMAFRRRFAFFNLEPLFNERWRSWCTKQGIRDDFAGKIKERLEDLNKKITEDKDLGAQYCIGHSFVTPNEQIADPPTWFKDVVETEISPLLDEYWFDKQKTANEEKTKLLRDL